MNSHTLQVLIVDDDDGDRKQIKRAIHQSGLAAECTETVSIKNALVACDEREFDCAIIDYRLPGEDGLEGITALHEKLPHMAIIMSTGQGDEMIAAEAIKRGASDYIAKYRITAVTVRRAIENAIVNCSLQRKVIQQQHELENFARVLAHDLRGPAGSIETFATRIGERLEQGNPEKALQAADWVIQTARRMNQLIETLYRYTTADAKVAFQAVDMNRALEEAQANLHQLIEEGGASVTAEILPPVLGSAPQLIQLLQNLIANGVKYCDKPVARIHVSAVSRRAPNCDEPSWLFSVADNGIGISKFQHTRIFEPFTRLAAKLNREGTGLGLATCKKLIERHGGTIWCESQPGSGTVFFFTLPSVHVEVDRIPESEETEATEATEETEAA